jgi:hypothetical protein
VLFGIFWRTAWAYFSRHRETTVAIVGYATLLPFMITWMRGNFTLPALQATMALAAVVVGAVLCRAPAGRAGSERGRETAGAEG